MDRPWLDPCRTKPGPSQPSVTAAMFCPDCPLAASLGCPSPDRAWRTSGITISGISWWEGSVPLEEMVVLEGELYSIILRHLFKPCLFRFLPHFSRNYPTWRWQTLAYSLLLVPKFSFWVTSHCMPQSQQSLASEWGPTNETRWKPVQEASFSSGKIHLQCHAWLSEHQGRLL